MTDALPDFTPGPEDSPYAALHKLLWANEPTPSQPGDSTEPEPLRKCIESWAADNLSLWTDSQGDVAMDVDEDGSEPPPPPPEVRYIYLRKHPTLCVHVLRDTSSTFVVRQEYIEFMAYAMKCEIEKRRFFLTGQPGIGKSLGACYFLFLLLASGQSVFFIPNPNWVYYFSAAGVQRAALATTNMDRFAIEAAVRRSWVLIDIDLAPTWFPARWIVPCASLVWTSSPQASRRHHFTKQFKARTWYMKPWSSQEIEAVTTLDDKNHEDVRDRFNRSGPVARDLFSAPEMAEPASIDIVINMALANNLFNFASFDMFLTQTQEVLDEAGRPFLERREYSLNFLSNYIASRTVELMERHVEKVRQQLAQAFDSPRTCSAAGKLVESMLLHALIHGKIDLPAAFGGGPVAGQLELIGKAEDFVLETHTPHQCDSRPLYLRPQSPNFAAFNAILVTEDILARLKTNKITVDSLDLVYCPIGTDEDRVKKLVRLAGERETGGAPG
ncbi:hypothetical protein B0H11DRAFT_2041681 [Mycena galericulata]|nr:hypothetical protein B0H11DRAFT_2041681 [Mycena galericulata]